MQGVGQELVEDGEGTEHDKVEQRQEDAGQHVSEALGELDEGGHGRSIAYFSGGARLAMIDAHMDTGLDGERGTARRRTWVWAALVALVAILPSIGTFGAGLISDDGAALGYVHSHGVLSDWFRPEYDLHTFRFWRPLVTFSLGLQELLTGASPVPLRLFNLAGHVATALLAMGLARQLGARVLGAALVGCLVGLFPYQGGTVTWIVGRVDSQCVPLALGAIMAALAGRSVTAGVLFFLALATKEIALAVPFAAAALVWARGAGWERSRTPLLVMGGVLVGTIVWRRLAIGTWIGGYPGGLAASLPGGLGLGAMAAGMGSVWESMSWLLVAGGLTLVACAALGAPGERRPRLRLLVGIALAGGLALVPLARSLVPGPIGAEHERVLMLADALGCLALGVLFARGASRGMIAFGGTLVLGLLTQRGIAAWQDTHEWARAGNSAEGLVSYVRETLADPENHVEPSSKPVLRANPPRLEGGAYVLQWGFADRFRAPFPETPRPVWPWRPLFDGKDVERGSVTRPELNLRWPFWRAPRMVPPLLVTDDSGGSPGPITLTPELFTESGPELHFTGSFPGARFEVLCFTELGYGIGLFGGPKVRGEMHAAAPGEEVPPPFGGAIGLRELLMLEPGGTGTGGPQLYEVISLAADFGATEAYLEFRAVDDARGKLDRPVGASEWVHLVWGPELRDAILPFDGFH